jgi:hypothetical protein
MILEPVVSIVLDVARECEESRTPDVVRSDFVGSVHGTLRPRRTFRSNRALSLLLAPKKPITIFSRAMQWSTRISRYFRHDVRSSGVTSFQNPRWIPKGRIESWRGLGPQPTVFSGKVTWLVARQDVLLTDQRFSERILEVAHLDDLIAWIHGHGHHVETERVPVAKWIASDVRAGCATDAPGLSGIHGKLRRIGTGGSSGFHLHEDQDALLSGHQVQFSVARTPVSRQDLVTVPAKPAGRFPFAEGSESIG